MTTRQHFDDWLRVWEEKHNDSDYSVPSMRDAYLAGRLAGLEEAVKIVDRFSYDSNDGYPMPRVIAVAAAIREKK